MARLMERGTLTSKDVNINQTDVAQEVTPEVAKRLVVELTRKSARDLAWLVDQEELNKTTLVNRALQVYRLIMQAQVDGKQIVIEERHDDTVERNTLLLV